MTEDFELDEPSDDFRHLPFDEMREKKINHREIKSVTHQNALSRWYNLEDYPLMESYCFVVGLSCDSRPLFIILNYDANSNSYVYHRVRLANGDELKKFWCS